MNITNIVLLVTVVCLGVLVLKNHNPSIGYILSLTAGVIVFAFCLPKINLVMNTVNNISEKAGIDNSLYESLIKCLGITYLTEWGANLCKDAGQNALCAKVELFGRIGVIIIVLPIVEEIINNIISIIK